jgi:MHS family proline/betaine transporter-like MFS transporter
VTRQSVLVSLITMQWQPAIFGDGAKLAVTCRPDNEVSTIGLLPSHASIGIWAPIMLVLCRLVQGVGASGEYTVAANYMLEHGPPDRRQYLAGWSVGSTSLGPLLASVVVLGLAASIGREGFEAGGWRIPFLLAAPLGLTTLYMRKHTRDLPRIEKALAKVAEGAPAAVPSMTALRDHWRSMVQVILLGAGQRVGSFCIQTYFVTALITKGSGRSAPCSRRSCAT